MFHTSLRIACAFSAILLASCGYNITAKPPVEDEAKFFAHNEDKIERALLMGGPNPRHYAAVFAEYVEPNDEKLASAGLDPKDLGRTTTISNFCRDADRTLTSGRDFFILAAGGENAQLVRGEGTQPSQSATEAHVTGTTLPAFWVVKSKSALGPGRPNCEFDKSNRIIIPFSRWEDVIQVNYFTTTHVDNELPVKQVVDSLVEFGNAVKSVATGSIILNGASHSIATGWGENLEELINGNMSFRQQSGDDFTFFLKSTGKSKAARYFVPLTLEKTDSEDERSHLGYVMFYVRSYPSLFRGVHVNGQGRPDFQKNGVTVPDEIRSSQDRKSGDTLSSFIASQRNSIVNVAASSAAISSHCNLNIEKHIGDHYGYLSDYDKTFVLSEILFSHPWFQTSFDQVQAVNALTFEAPTYTPAEISNPRTRQAISDRFDKVIGEIRSAQQQLNLLSTNMNAIECMSQHWDELSDGKVHRFYPLALPEITKTKTRLEDRFGEISAKFPENGANAARRLRVASLMNSFSTLMSGPADQRGELATDFFAPGTITLTDAFRNLFGDDSIRVSGTQAVEKLSVLFASDFTCWVDLKERDISSGFSYQQLFDAATNSDILAIYRDQNKSVGRNGVYRMEFALTEPSQPDSRLHVSGILLRSVRGNEFEPFTKSVSTNSTCNALLEEIRPTGDTEQPQEARVVAKTDTHPAN